MKNCFVFAVATVLFVGCSTPSSSTPQGDAPSTMEVFSDLTSEPTDVSVPFDMPFNEVVSQDVVAPQDTPDTSRTFVP
jgi:hypothetical protein